MRWMDAFGYISSILGGGLDSIHAMTFCNIALFIEG
jgi:hypothetical protein